MSNPNQTTKGLSERDYQQTLRGAFNDVDKSYTTSTFLSAKIGNKITQVISTTTVSNDTATFSFYSDQTLLLYSLKLIFTDSTQGTLISAERTA